jgi:glycosyltransferase involved in cell wall biosynthesis
MNIAFFEPPPALKAGGLEAAISGLRNAIASDGVQVEINPSFGSAAYDIVHFHGLWQPLHSRISRLCRQRRISYVVSPHGMLEPWAWRHKWWKKWPYFHLAEKRHLSGASALLATGEMEADQLRRFFPAQRIEVLPLGLTGAAKPDYENARETLGWPENEQVLLFLSRIHEKKGLDLLLQALAALKNRLPVCRLVIIGGGEAGYVAQLKAFCERHSDQLPRIEWMGEIWGEDRWNYLKGADLFCLPTHSENFGLAVLEALQVGTQVLTTETTPWGGWLRDRGFIAKPDSESIQQALMRYFDSIQTESPARREALASWAWEYFDWRNLAPRYMAFYQTLLAEERSN